MDFFSGVLLTIALVLYLTAMVIQVFIDYIEHLS